MEPFRVLTDQMSNMAQMIQDLAERLQHQEQLRSVPAAVPSMPNPNSEPHVKLPDRFLGDRKTFRSFKESCKLYFRLRPHSSGSEQQRVGIIISLLQGDPQEWAFSLPSDSPCLSSVEAFFQALGLLYEETDVAAVAENQLRSLRQGNRPVEDYCAEFRKWCVSSEWNDPALRSQFKVGLSDHLKDLLVSYPSPDTLDSTMTLAIRLDRRFRERQRERRTAPQVVVSPDAPTQRPPPAEVLEEPMLLGLTMRDQRRLKGACFYCGEMDHWLQQCPRLPASKKSLPRNKVSPRVVRKKFLLPITISHNLCKGSGEAFVDSGSASNFIDFDFAQAVGIPTIPLKDVIQIIALDSTPLGNGRVEFCTPEVTLTVGVSHSEICSFLVLKNLPADLVLGLPWLQDHNPVINWSSGELEKWGSKCNQCCKSILQAGTTVESLVLPEYIRDFLDVFTMSETDFLPPHRPYDCSIEIIEGSKYPKGRIYNLSAPERQAMKDYLTESLAKGHIRPSVSPMGAGFFFVSKKDGGLRPCIDYRELNKISVKNRYPLPLIPDLLNQVQGACWFSKLDLKGAYNLIRIREGDEWKTAFNTPEGHYEYQVMPFGLSNAPAVFQNFVNDIFRPFLGRFMIVYIDDILIFSADWESHVSHTRQVLEVLRKNLLFVKGEKCTFGVQEVAFLGYILTPFSFKMDPAKVQAILDWVRPTSLKALQRFLGFANFYRKFIKNFSVMAKPITDLTRKGADLANWSPAAKKAFESLKRSFINAPVLIQPDQTKPFIVEVDASEDGVGAVLSQGSSTFTNLKPCAFFSRKFSPAEKNYDIGNRELLAIKWAFEEWRHFLEGALHRVMVLTDHKNLMFLESAKRLNPRQARWALFFTRFDFCVTFRPGSKNIKADALSRSFHACQLPEGPPEPILPANIIVAAATADLASEILAGQHLAPPDTPTDKLFVPAHLRLRLLGECHNSVLCGHPGINATKELISREFWWPSISRDVQAFVTSCSTCARSKNPKTRPMGELHPLPIPDRPWSHLSMDFITDLPCSDSKTVIWVVVDRFSKMCHLISLRKLPTAKVLASLFIDHIVRIHGIPENIVSDRGVQFVSRFWKAFCHKIDISLSFSSAFHPETNGQTERLNQSVEQFLRCYVADNQHQWSRYLSLAEFAINNRVNTSSGISPFFCNMGFHPRFGSFSLSTSVVPEVNSFAQELCTVWAQVQTNLKKAQETQKVKADRKRSNGVDFKVGDKVWLSTKNLKMKVPSYKFAPRFIGPYEITKVINPVSFKLCLPESFRIHNVFHKSLLKGYVAPVCPENQPPPPVQVAGQEEHEVASIIDVRKVRNSFQYLVHWRGFGPEDRSWVPLTRMHADTLIRNFHRMHPEKPAPVVKGPVAPHEGGGTVMGGQRRTSPVLRRRTSAGNMERPRLHSNLRGGPGALLASSPPP